MDAANPDQPTQYSTPTPFYLARQDVDNDSIPDEAFEFNDADGSEDVIQNEDDLGKAGASKFKIPSKGDLGMILCEICYYRRCERNVKQAHKLLELASEVKGWIAELSAEKPNNPIQTSTCDTATASIGVARQQTGTEQVDMLHGNITSSVEELWTKRIDHVRQVVQDEPTPYRSTRRRKKKSTTATVGGDVSKTDQKAVECKAKPSSEIGAFSR